MPLNLPEIPEKREPAEACLGKTRFRERTLAASVARRMSRAKDCALVPYDCPFCKGWHVGRTLDKKKPPPKRGPDRQRIMRRMS